MAVRWIGATEVNLGPDLETKLARAVDYDDWFLREVDQGLAPSESGDVLTHDAVGARLGKRLTGKQPRP